MGPQPPTVLAGVDSDRRLSGRAIVDVPAPIANLFARAEEGSARKDWKFAIDSLQRIIDHPEGALVLRPTGATEHEVLYESARRRAIRRLTMLPQEALEAYRLLYDGKAKGLYERALAAHDPEGLRIVANRYLLTRYGDEASERLASWALDAGRPLEAIDLLTTLMELVPDFDVPQKLVVSKLAAAHTMLGHRLEARSILATHFEDVGVLPEAKSAENWMVALVDSIPQSWSAADHDLDQVSSWPMFGGTPSRRGLMPPVMPTLVHPLPWRFNIPGTTGARWPQIGEDDPDDPLDLPPLQLALDGDRVFVRTAEGVTALDADDLRPIWTVPADEDSLLRRRGRVAGGLADSTSERAGLFPLDVLRGITVARNMVLTVDNGDGPSVADVSATSWAHWIVRGMGFSDVLREFARATRLNAYDATSGQIRWTRGRTADPADVLGAVEFGSIPLVVGDVLWVLFFRQRDLFVAVLDPSDGSLLREIPLCSVDRPKFRAPPSPHAAYAYGAVYVATGHGILLAVDAVDYTLRWANQYAFEVENGPAGTSDRGSPWMDAPPVASGGLVLLAPADYPELMAFSAVDGRLRWATPVSQAAYIIAVDDQRIWLGGRHISRLSIADGAADWSTPVASTPTGRAVRAGDLVHVPTMEGLLSLDADTGDVLNRQPLPGSAHPLGNLVCVRSAMFSIDPSAVRKYPGLSGGYPDAAARFESDPTDVQLARQLAWLELFRGEPARALEVVDSISAALVDEDPVQAEHVAHVRVEALLALAKDSATDPAAALSLLERASQSAMAVDDRIRSSLALADHLDAMGQYLQAYRILWDSGRRSEADHFISLADYVEGKARIAISDRLQRTVARLADNEVERLHDAAHESLLEVVDALKGSPAQSAIPAQLRAIADSAPFSAIGQRALLELADRGVKQERYEYAEQLLARCARLDSNRATTADALVRLCELYRTEDHDLVQPLVVRLDELRRRFEADPYPELVRRGPRSATRGAAGPAIGDWVTKVQSELSASARAAARRWVESAPFVLTGDVAWSLPGQRTANPPRLVNFGDNASAALVDRLVFLGPRETIYCIAASDARALWLTQLRLPETFSGLAGFEGDDADRPRRAVADGQIAVFAGTDGLFAIGLVTGKRLWARAYESPRASREPWYGDMTMAAADGLLAAMPRAGRLSLLRLTDGATLWERDLRGEPVAYVWMLSGRVVTADAHLTRVHVFRREDGRLIKRLLFHQPDPRHDLVNLVHTQGILYGPQATGTSDGVVAVDLATGEPVWRLTLDKPLVQLFRPQEEYMGIGLLGGDVWIVDAKTGEIVLDRRVPGARAVTDGVLFDGTLLVRHIQLVGGKPLPRLVALDVATGDLIWHRHDFASAVGVNASLRLFDGCLPAIIEYSDEGLARRKAMGLAVIDARTGQNVGPDVKLVAADSRTTFSGDFRIFPGGILIGTDEAFVALGTQPLDRRGRGGS